MRNDEANDRRRRVSVPKDDEPFDICCGCGAEMPYTPTSGPRIVRIWCDDCLDLGEADEEDEELFDGDVCPRCNVEPKDLHPEDGLCPKCETEWIQECFTRDVFEKFDGY
jgi:ribosomal protein L40E